VVPEIGVNRRSFRDSVVDFARGSADAISRFTSVAVVVIFQFKCSVDAQMIRRSARRGDRTGNDVTERGAQARHRRDGTVVSASGFAVPRKVTARTVSLAA